MEGPAVGDGKFLNRHKSGGGAILVYKADAFGVIECKAAFT